MASEKPNELANSPTAMQHESLSPSTATKKARRQTAFYPNTANKPQKPFSRSAAKRESVMALGSIEHLQHYFTKTGIAARKNPLKPNSNLVPAIGRGLLQLQTDLYPSGHEPTFILPPSPAVPPPLHPAFPPFVKTYQTDPEMLKPGVIEDLEVVERTWGLDQAGEHPGKLHNRELLGSGLNDQAPGNVNVLSALKTTTNTIRSVRNYLVSLPDDFASQQAPQVEFRPHSLSPPTVAQRKISRSALPNDPLALIRRSALDVLTILRNLEETARVPLSDEVYEVQSDAGSASTRSHTPGGTERVASPFTSTSGDDDDESTASFSFSVVKVPSQKNRVPVWSDEESVGDEDAEEKKERWDERLVLGGGWLYKQDLSLDQLGQERDAIGRYLNAVDKVLFGWTDGEKRGWQKEKERLAAERLKESRTNKGRRASSGNGEDMGLSPHIGGRGRRVVSAGMIDALRDMVVSEEPEEMLNSVTEEEDENEEDGIDDDELPDWAKRSKFMDDPLARLLSLLVTLLPPDLLCLLPPPSDSDRAALLLRLSSGQILCTAYNIAVRKSRKPWGYITKTAIHDIAALEAQVAEDAEGDIEKRKTGWTFRRKDNLRLWAAALKLRYMLPLGIPKNTSQGNTPGVSPIATQQSFPNVIMEPTVSFDPQLVAKREEGWDGMLETAVLRWMWCVVAERRGCK